MKFVIILFLVLGLLLMGVLFFLRIIRNTIANIFTNSVKQQRSKEDDVLFKNEDIVVLKGDAEQKKNKWEENLKK